MSGSVIATYDSTTGALAIKGDAKSNSIVISYDLDHYTVTGLAGTKINGKATPLVLTDFNALSMDMGNGDDTVNIALRGGTHIYPGAPINISTGKGDDTVTMDGVIVDPGGSINIDTGAGNDKVSLVTRSSFFYFGDLGQPASVTINLGSGNDRYSMEGFVLFGGSLTIDAGSGKDVIDFPPLPFGQLRVANPGVPINIFTGPGVDIVTGLETIEGGLITVT